MPKKPELCNSNDDCIVTEACYMGYCVNPCQFTNICPKNAECIAQLHRASCICKEGDITQNCTSSHVLCKKI